MLRIKSTSKLTRSRVREVNGNIPQVNQDIAYEKSLEVGMDKRFNYCSVEATL